MGNGGWRIGKRKKLINIGNIQKKITRLTNKQDQKK